MRKQALIPAALWVLFGLLLLAPVVYTDGGSATLTKAAATYYNAADNIKDLVVDVKHTRGRGVKAVVIECQYFWKAPEKVWIEGKKVIPGLDVTASHVMPARELWAMVQSLKKMNVTESKEGDVTKIEATPKAGDSSPAATYFVDAQNHITHVLTSKADKFGAVSKVDIIIECEEKDGKRLLTSMTEKYGGAGKMTKWEYAEVSGAMLVSKESHQDFSYRSETEFLNPVVNHGIDDATFHGLERPPTPGDKPKKDEAKKDEAKKDEGKKDEGKKDGALPDDGKKDNGGK